MTSYDFDLVPQVESRYLINSFSQSIKMGRFEKSFFVVENEFFWFTKKSEQIMDEILIQIYIKKESRDMDLFCFYFFSSRGVL